MSEKLYYRISEVARMVGVEPSTLRFWESQFPQIQPKRNGKDRLYSPADIELFQTIKYLLKEEKYTIEGAKQKLKSLKKKPPERKELIGLLLELKETLKVIKKNLK